MKRKLADYHRVGVPYYVIVDQERAGSPRRLLGYEWHEDGYGPLDRDEMNRLLLPAVGVAMNLEDNELVCST